jgi:hypothetical protein
MSREALIKVAAELDKARAFELGFAKAAAEHGLSADEYRQMCFIASNVINKTANAPQQAPPIQPINVTPGDIATKQKTEAAQRGFIADRKKAVLSHQPVKTAAETPKPKPKGADVDSTSINKNPDAPVKTSPAKATPPVKQPIKPANPPMLSSPGVGPTPVANVVTGEDLFGNKVNPK